MLPLAVFPVRARSATSITLRTGIRAFGWLFRSREFANYTYALTQQNREYLAWFVANVSGRPLPEILGYFEELENDGELMSSIESRLKNARRRKELDGNIQFGRRLGWYALIRALRPRTVVETGTEKGLGSVVIARALERNGDSGTLFTIDIEPSSGLLIGPELASRVTRIIGDSVTELSRLDGIDFFIHDSDHSPEHERAEFDAVAPRLSPGGICLSDNSHVTSVLARWSLERDREFLFFKEEPDGHWYPGAGIGASFLG